MSVDYNELAEELMQSMMLLRKTGQHKHVQEGIHGEAFILHLIKNCRKMVPGEVCCEMGISSARVAAVLNNLEDKGFITRRIDTDDRRRVIVELTSEGEVKAEEHLKDHIRKIVDVLMVLGEHDAKEHVRIIRKLAEALSKE
jgi:DNA-binding MarR family transcriptional regulator